MEKRFAKLNKIMIAGALFVTLFMSLLIVVKQFPSVWNDEDTGLLFLKKNWGEMWKEIASDVHPPMFFLINKPFAMIFGDHYRVYKLVQLLPLFLMHLWTSILVIKDKKLICKPSTGALVVLFIFGTFSPSNFMGQNVELRMYSWAMFFVTMNGVYAYRLVVHRLHTINDSASNKISLKYRADDIIFILTGLGAALSHYYALFAEVFIYIFLFLGIVLVTKKRDKKEISVQIAKYAVPTIIGYSWWLPFAINQLTGSQVRIAWIGFTYTDVTGYIGSLIGYDHEATGDVP